MIASLKSWIFSPKFYHKSFIIFTFAIWIFKISEHSLCIVQGKVTHYFFPTLKSKGMWPLLLKCPFFLAHLEASPLLKSTCAYQWSSALGLSSELDSFFHPWAMPHYLNYCAFRIKVSIPSCVKSSALFVCKIVLGVCGLLQSLIQFTISISIPTM